MNVIDLRSDTVTQPTPAMRRAMAEAPVGDDVYGEDPTVNRLEALAAERLGKEAALFVPSGTMGNLISLLVVCGRGDEYIVGDNQHTYIYEAGGASAVGSIHPRVVPNLPDGTMALQAIEAAIRPDNVHFPRTRLIALENTHNRMGGRILPPEYVAQVRALADRHGLWLHGDGARLWNAAVALGASPAELAAPFDSLSVCLSKGLAAPVGSLVVGSRDFIAEARRARKVLGGGMRQAGILAAAGIVALTEMIPRLAEDHANAQRLADGLEALGYRVHRPVETNIVVFELPEPRPEDRMMSAWREQGLLVSSFGGGRFRAVTHNGIEPSHVEQALRVLATTL
ncbi:MAG: low-specificity L-threonine aldolase [Ardenticatenia bacterium]|nr:low-specificity L-threonine aldolase [Ardenticatenia bacterium]